MTDFYSRKQIQAIRRSHLCNECHQTIPKGSPCDYVAGRGYDGFYGFWAHRDCLDCADALMHEISPDCRYDSWYGLLEEIQNTGEDWRACFRPLFDEWPEVQMRLDAAFPPAG